MEWGLPWTGRNASQAPYLLKKLHLFHIPSSVVYMSRESNPASPSSRPPANQRGTDGGDIVLAALDFLRGGVPADVGTCGPPTLARQKEDLRQWADRLGLLLNSSDLPAQVVRGGQEHELFNDEVTDRYFKVLRDGKDLAAVDLHYLSNGTVAGTVIILKGSGLDESNIEPLLSSLDDEFLPDVDLAQGNLSYTVVLGEVLGNWEATTNHNV